MMLVIFFKFNEKLILNYAKLRELSINLKNIVKNHQKNLYS